MIRLFKRIYCSVFFVLTFLIVHGQDTLPNYFHQKEIELSKLAGQLTEIRFNDSLLFQTNFKLQELFSTILKTEGSFNYSFDSLTNIGYLKSDDGRVKIFTWNIVKTNGTHQHFGYIQYFIKEKKQVVTHTLQDNSDSIADAENAVLTPENWFGATYYQILTHEHTSGTIYTLIGWDGNNLYTTKKIIDILQFNASGKAKFGKPVFKAGKRKLKRIIFEYSRMATMMIKYDTDYKMIILDHLAPSNAMYNGNFRFYGPDLSYDGLKFIDDFWEYVPTIDYKKNKSKKGFF